MLRHSLLPLLAACLCVGCTRSAPEQLRAPAQGPDRTILDNVRATDRLSTLADALDTTGLADALGTAGPITLFAPTNAAFAALPDDVRTRMAPGAPERYNVLAYHLVPARVAPADFDGRSLHTLHGGALHLGRDGATLTVNRQPVLDTLLASNGVVYLIDAVLLPPGAQD